MYKSVVEQRKGSSETIKTSVSKVTIRPPCELRSSSLESTFAFSDDKSPKALIQGLQNLGKSLEVIEIKTTPQNSDIIASPEGPIVCYSDTTSATEKQITISNANLQADNEVFLAPQTTPIDFLLSPDVTQKIITDEVTDTSGETEYFHLPVTPDGAVGGKVVDKDYTDADKQDAIFDLLVSKYNALKNDSQKDNDTAYGIRHGKRLLARVLSI